MISRRVMVAGGALGLAACAQSMDEKFRSYDGPQVTRIQVFKEARKLQLIHGQELLKVYDFELGFTPDGHKRQQGDGRTPEGVYFIDRKNPASRFHLSIGISYPNFRDRARARAAGVTPGGDIFIHGTPDYAKGKSDWTYGCIAVSNPEMEEIYAMVQTRTPIFIYP